MLRKIRSRLQARLAQLEEHILGLRDFETLPTPKHGALTIICDDGAAQDIEVAEVLSEAGARGVFAVCPDLIGGQQLSSYSQLRRLQDAGHEIAFHGTIHVPFTHLGGRRGIADSVREGLCRLADEGLIPSTLVYPYGTHNRIVRAAVAPMFECAFTTLPGLNHGNVNRYAIRRIAFGAYGGSRRAEEQRYRTILERAAANKCWPVLMLHPGMPTHLEAHTAMLSRLLAYAKELGLSILTASAQLAALKSQMASVQTVLQSRKLAT